jgi:putative peptidoglycan lipid II flippase
MVVAHSFGTQVQVDRYYVAFTIACLVPTLAQTLLWAVFVPIFIRRFMQDERGVWRFSNITLSWLFLTLIVSTAGLVFHAHQWIRYLAPGFDLEAVSSTSRLLYVLAPVLALMGINIQLMAILNAMKVFGVATVSQTLPSLVSLVAILMLGGRMGIASVAWGWTLGSFLQTFVLGWYCRRAGYRYRFQLFPLSCVKELASTGALYLVPTVSVLFVTLVDRSYASLLGIGNIATLNYGDKLFRIPMTVLTTSLFTVSLSYLAESAAKRDMDHFRETASLALRFAAFLLFPAAAIFYICREPITSLAYQRGAFSTNDTRIVAATMLFFAPHVVVHGLWCTVERSLIALGKFGTLTVSSLVMVAVKLTAASLLYRPLGLPGIVLSTLLCFLAGLAINYAVMIREVGMRSLRNDATAIGRVALATIVAGAASLATDSLLVRYLSLESLLPINAARVLAACGVGGAMYLLVSRWLAIPEAASLQCWAQRRFNHHRLTLMEQR